MKQLFTKQYRIISMTLAMSLGTVACTKTEAPEPFAAEPEHQEQLVVLAPTRNHEEALVLAQRSIGIVDRGTTRSLRPRALRDTQGQCVTVPATRNGETRIDTLMYVFNFEDNNGFSIIAANRTVEPVLAVAEKGNYTYGKKTGVANFDFYMEALTEELRSTPKPPTIDTLINLPNFKTIEVDEERHCDPLVPVNWGQSGVFGEYADNGKAGCVATAMAQIMAYYRYPGSITTTYPNNGFTQHYGETIELDWERMITYLSGYQISALLREIGEKVGMDYVSSKTSSGASPSNVPNGFKSFGFQCASGYSSFNIASIQSALDKKRPVYVDGREAQNTRSGHAWVAEGYSYTRKGTEYYELKLIDDGIRQYRDYVLTSSTVVTTSLVYYNWGWDGLYNGYFAAKNTCEAAGSTFVNMKSLTPYF